MGVSRFLKEKNPDIQMIGLQPSEGAAIAGIRKWPKEYLPKIFQVSHPCARKLLFVPAHVCSGALQLFARAMVQFPEMASLKAPGGIHCAGAVME